MSRPLGVSMVMRLGDVTWNVADDDGGVQLAAVLDGWDVEPEPRGSHLPRSYAPGALPGRVLHGTKPLTLRGLVTCLNAEAAEATAQAVALTRREVLSDAGAVLTVEEPGRAKRLRVHALPGAPGQVEWLSPTAFLVELPMVAVDPYKEDAADPAPRSTGPRQAVYGRGYPTAYPYGYDKLAAGLVGGEVVLDNVGTADAYPTLRINGPAPVGTEVTRMESGRGLRLAVALAAGEWVVLDLRRRVLLHRGVFPQRKWLSPGYEWFAIEPGRNTLRLTTPTPSTSTRLRVADFRSAWL